MSFTSWSFAGLVCVTFILYYFPKLNPYQFLILILSSLLFYSFNQPRLVLLLVVSACVNTLASYMVTYGRTAGRRKLSAVLGVGLNLALLIFFKYGPLFGRTFFPSRNDIGQFLVTIPLPIGISFFTFKGISLVVDAFRNRRTPDAPALVAPSLADHFLSSFLFLSFFSQLLAGPIVKAGDFLPHIKSKYLNDIDREYVFRKLVAGYFLKMVIADNLKDQTFWIAYPYFQAMSSLTLATMMFGYSFQIFADFAGYSLIALGITALFGYKLEENFNFPYLSSSFAEFWRRWHISLSSFLKNYLYIPLGGNRKGTVRTYANLMITMFLGGLWHGAAWSYLVWGSFHGAALAIERFFKERFSLPPTMLIGTLKIVCVFLFVTFAWLLFKLPDFTQAVDYVKAMRSNTRTPNNYPIIMFTIIYSIPVVLYHGLHAVKIKGNARIEKYEFLLYGAMIFLILTNSGSSGVFIYFQF